MTLFGWGVKGLRQLYSESIDNVTLKTCNLLNFSPHNTNLQISVPYKCTYKMISNKQSLATWAYNPFLSTNEVFHCFHCFNLLKFLGTLCGHCSLYTHMTRPTTVISDLWKEWTSQVSHTHCCIIPTTNITIDTVSQSSSAIMDELDCDIHGNGA